MKLARVILGIALLANFFFGIRQCVLRINYGDFYVYDTAASLVRSGQNLLIYNDADNGIDPQVRWAHHDSRFAGAARQLGIDPVRLYVYPPLLADLLIPFSFLPAISGAHLWVVLCLVMLVAAGAIAGRAMGAQWRSWTMFAWIFAVVGLGLYSLSWGQVTPFLCLLWSVGIFTYKKESPALSAAALALGTAIKLTPLLAVVPFLVCLEWKWLRAYALSLVALLAAMALVNGPASLVDYQVHVLPAMSGGYPDPYNFSISSSLRLLYHMPPGQSSVTSIVPKMLTDLGSLLAVVATCWMIRKRRKSLSQQDWWAIIAAMSILSVSLAPVSFQQAYIVVAFPLGFLWLDLLRGDRRPWFDAFVFTATLEYATFFTKIFRQARLDPVGGAVCALIPAAIGIAVALLLVARAPALPWHTEPQVSES